MSHLPRSDSQYSSLDHQNNSLELAWIGLLKQLENLVHVSDLINDDVVRETCRGFKSFKTLIRQYCSNHKPIEYYLKPTSLIFTISIDSWSNVESILSRSLKTSSSSSQICYAFDVSDPTPFIPDPHIKIEKYVYILVGSIFAFESRSRTIVFHFANQQDLCATDLESKFEGLKLVQTLALYVIETAILVEDKNAEKLHSDEHHNTDSAGQEGDDQERPMSVDTITQQLSNLEISHPIAFSKTRDSFSLRGKTMENLKRTESAYFELRNRGNTCFIDALFYFLYYTLFSFPDFPTDTDSEAAKTFDQLWLAQSERAASCLLDTLLRNIGHPEFISERFRRQFVEMGDPSVVFLDIIKVLRDVHHPCLSYFTSTVVVGDKTSPMQLLQLPGSETTSLQNKLDRYLTKYKLSFQNFPPLLFIGTSKATPFDIDHLNLKVHDCAYQLVAMTVYTTRHYISIVNPMYCKKAIPFSARRRRYPHPSGMDWIKFDDLFQPRTEIVDLLNYWVYYKYHIVKLWAFMRIDVESH